MSGGVSTPTTRLRIEQQAAGTNVSTWGDPHLNQALQRVEESICGFCSLANVVGPLSLTTANFTGDQAHFAVLNITSGTGGAITIPSVEKLYTVINNTSGIIQITTGAGAVASLAAGSVSQVACDSSNCLLVQSAAFTAVPTQAGNAGGYLTTDGATPSWGNLKQMILRRTWLLG